MSQSDSPIIGIDLGTTNSVVAAFIDGRVQVIREDGDAILPSVVAMTGDGKLVVGHAARNQMAAFPDRTVASIKRSMGQATKLDMADEKYSPQELSAMILRRLRARASQMLGVDVTRAVITVPAFFDEHQRQATREAGQLAGLTVERIINEPTAASLVYHADSEQKRHLIVYDLGGGTFDVSIVRLEQGVIEVLSSRGDTQLGGDDFDHLLAKHIAGIFLTQYDFDLLADPSTRWRLMHACERAKCELSSVGVVRVAEEFIATIGGQPVSLDVELSRTEYEELISPLVERTVDCVDEAIRDSGVSVAQLDELILVGGSTRTPLVQRRLSEEFRQDPIWAVNPDLAVSLGAATQAAMHEGHSVGAVLIDVATHTLGIEALQHEDFTPKLRFSPIIRRNSPLPAKFEDTYHTVAPGQRRADIHVYQGESRQLSQNRSIGRFVLEGLDESEDAEGAINVRFELTLDGTLDVTAIERATGTSKSLRIDNALSQVSDEVRQNVEERLGRLFDGSDEIGDEADRTIDAESHSEARTMKPITRIDTPEQPVSKLASLITKAESLRDRLSNEDTEDLDRILELLERAEQDSDHLMVEELQTELDDLLFYLAE